MTASRKFYLLVALGIVLALLLGALVVILALWLLRKEPSREAPMVVIKETPSIQNLPLALPGFPAEATRPPGGLSQVGLLVSEGTETGRPILLPLFGRRMHQHGSRWQYWAYSKDLTAWKIPVALEGRNCSADTGCNEVFDGDTLSVPAYDGVVFRAQIYRPEPLYFADRF